MHFNVQGFHCLFIEEIYIFLNSGVGLFELAWLDKFSEISQGSNINGKKKAAKIDLSYLRRMSFFKRVLMPWHNKNVNHNFRILFF